MSQDTRQGLQLEANMYGVPSVQETPKPVVTAVPSRQEFEAKVSEYTPSIKQNPLVSDMKKVADDLEWEDEKKAESYKQMMQDVAAQEMWLSKEQARRKAQADMAWEQHARERDAARARDIREYEDKDPSWGYSMMEQPITKNTIGVRRYNPYTGEMEWHYPRNAAEGVATGITSLLNLAYGSVAGLAGHPYAGMQLVDRNRKIQQDKFYGPYALDNAIKQRVISGQGPAIPDTLANKASASIAEKELLRDVGERWQKQDAQSNREAMKADYDYILANFGEEAAKNYLLGKFGVKKDAASDTYDGAMSLSQMALQSQNPADIELAKQALQTTVLATKDPVKRANIMKMSRALDGAALWSDNGKVQQAPQQSSPERRREDLLISEMLKDGELSDEEFGQLLNDPAIRSELQGIIDQAQGVPEASRGAFLQRALRGSNAVRNLTRGWSDLFNLDTITPYGAVKIVDENLLSISGGLRRGLHKKFPNAFSLDPNYKKDRRLMLEEALLKKLSGPQGQMYESLPYVPPTPPPAQQAPPPTSAVQEALINEKLAYDKAWQDSLSNTNTQVLNG